MSGESEDLGYKYFGGRSQRHLLWQGVSSQLVQSRKETERGFVTSGNPRRREPESVTRMFRCVNTWLAPPWLSINCVKEVKLVTLSDIPLSFYALSIMKEINPSRFSSNWVVWENIEGWLEEQLLDSVWWGQSRLLQWDWQLHCDYLPRGDEKWKGKFLRGLALTKACPHVLTDALWAFLCWWG